tara:strand:- start:318 stop:491 length:174 start_codon:yes stop_codon:yes gene_type:complete
MKLEIQVKNIYGRDVVYPVCEKSQLLTRLSGNRTLTDEAIAVIKKLGYTFTTTTMEI